MLTFVLRIPFSVMRTTLYIQYYSLLRQIPPGRGCDTHELRKGVCSNYLASTVPQQDSIRLNISKTSFRLPSDMSSPVIMVGPGTGISPMLGFLQAREMHSKDTSNVLGNKLGPCTVYFGCRGIPDYLHKEQMEKWHADGIITDLQVQS
jgi:sulfite reductase alpha subunit-like flavoprotein